MLAVLLLLDPLRITRQKLRRRNDHERIDPAYRTLPKIQPILLLLLVPPFPNAVQAKHVVTILEKTKLKSSLEHMLGTDLADPVPLRNCVRDTV
jgi:hypothetical protein